MGFFNNIRQRVAERKEVVKVRKELRRKTRQNEMIEERKVMAVEKSYYNEKVATAKARSALRKQKYAPVLNAVKNVRSALKQTGAGSALPQQDLFPSSKSSDDLLGMSKRAVPKKKVAQRKKTKVYFEYR